MSRPIARVAMVLAAGRGERMMPLSSVLPKPALPLPDGPVVSWAIKQAVRAGATRIVVNAWHIAHQLEQAVDEVRPLHHPDVEIVISREPVLMDTAGGIALAAQRGLLGEDGPVLVINGDGVMGLDLEPLLRRHTELDDQVTLALLPHLDPQAWSRIILDSEDQVTTIAPPGTPAPGEVPLLYPGVMLVAREVVESLPSVPSAINQTLWQPALAVGRLGGAVVTGHWREIGRPESYLQAAIAHLDGHSRLDPTAHVDESAHVISSLIGRQARLENGAVVEGSVVAEGAVVEAGARVIRSVVLGNIHVGSGDVVLNETRAAGGR
jgi:mannose-1-phosphate guanylyltransferase